MGWFARTRKRHRILLLGSPSVGKTTLIYRLSDQPIPDIMVPTAAAVLEKPVEAPKGHKFIFSEQKEETEGASAIIYIISRDNVDEGLKDIKALLAKRMQPTIPLMVLVNKQDLCVDEDDLDEVAYQMAPLIGTARSWAVRGCSGATNEGLEGIVEWLETQLPLY